MSWKNWPYWSRTGFLFANIYAIIALPFLIIIFFACKNANSSDFGCAIISGILTYSVFFPGLILGLIFWAVLAQLIPIEIVDSQGFGESVIVESVLFYITSIITVLLFGMLIGFLLGRYKKNRR